MASSSSTPLPTLLLFTLLATSFLMSATAAVAKPNLNLITDAFDFETAAMSLAGEFTNGEDQLGRRSLFWRAMRYYISYGALSANRIPCPPRSGRSYYTHNCFKARGPVRPYTRGCSAITRCRR